MEEQLVSRIYIAAEALPTTRKMGLIYNKGFAKVVLNENFEASIIHISSLNLKLITINSAWKAQMGLLLIKEIIVPIEYADFIDVFSKELANVLPEKTSINKNTILLVNDKQLPYGPI